jgi:hypothetical protein
MVMRIQANQTVKHSQRHLMQLSTVARRPFHTGQDQVHGVGAVSASIHLRQDLVTSQLDQRRRLRLAYIQRQSELSSAFSVEIDAQLLTGDLDQDISILSIVA